jgi:DNA invertase Pin-like site-specific DNA recombinase
MFSVYNIFKEVMIMRVAIYHRIANKNKTSQIELQQEIEMLKIAADNNDYEIVMIEYDFGSGLDYKREGLLKIKDAIKNKQIDILIVKDISRIGRNTFNNFEFVKFMQDNNVELYVVNK